MEKQISVHGQQYMQEGSVFNALLIFALKLKRASNNNTETNGKALITVMYTSTKKDNREEVLNFNIVQKCK